MYVPEQSFSSTFLSVELWKTLLSSRHWHWKNAVLFFGLCLGITGFFALFNLNGAIVSQISYFANRPLQVEATGSTLLWLGALVGFPVHIVYSFGSVNMVSSLGGVVSNLSEILFVAGYIYSIYLQWRGKLDVVQVCIAILFVFIATGKVFSPQYLIWIIPLLAYSGAFNRIWLVAWGSLSLLTTIIYPYLYTRVIDAEKIPFVPGFIPIVAVRNMLFILVTLAYLFNWFQMRRRRPLHSKEMISAQQEEPLLDNKKNEAEN